MSTATVNHGPLLVQLLGNLFGYTGQRATCQVRQDSFICQHLRSFADTAEIHLQLDPLPQVLRLKQLPYCLGLESGGITSRVKSADNESRLKRQKRARPNRARLLSSFVPPAEPVIKADHDRSNPKLLALPRPLGILPVVESLPRFGAGTHRPAPGPATCERDSRCSVIFHSVPIPCTDLTAAS